jgi:hypothetical protein
VPQGAARQQDALCASCRSPRPRGDTRRVDRKILPNERTSDLYPTEAGTAYSDTAATEPRQRELLVGPKLLSTLRSGVATVANSSHKVYVAAELADLSVRTPHKQADSAGNLLWAWARLGPFSQRAASCEAAALTDG